MLMQETSPTFRNAGIDIVCFSLSRWDAAISSPAVSLAKAFSQHHRLFFIQHPYSYKDALTHRRSSKTYTDGKVTIVTPPLVYPINFLPEGRLYAFLSSINQSIVEATLIQLVREQNISRYLFVNFFDPFFLRSIPSVIRPEKYVYQCMDDLSQVPYTRRHGVRLEEEVIRKADVVVCTSKQLTRLKSALAPHVHYHPNAADFTLFNTAATLQYPRPSEMPSGKKIIGFTGSIEYRTDFQLLRKIATAHPEKILFLMGPVIGREHLDAGLDRLPNVVFAGSRNIQQLPRYIQHFDCCIIPYKINTLTASIYPLKINEYLAAGKPVIATRFSEDIESFQECAYIAGSHEAFLSMISTAITEDDAQKKEQRIWVASQNTWEKRVEQFWQIVT